MPITKDIIETHVNGSKLNLKNMGLKDKDMPIVCEFLSERPDITFLNVCENEIGAQGAVILARNNSLRILDICFNHIGTEGAKALADNKNLISLKVGWNQIRDEGAIALANNKSLIKLDVTGNYIGVKGALAIESNKVLRFLDIKHNQIGLFGKKIMITMLERNRQIVIDFRMAALLLGAASRSIEGPFSQLPENITKCLVLKYLAWKLGISDKQRIEDTARFFNKNYKTSKERLAACRQQMADERIIEAPRYS